MSLITRCPACATQFKVVPEQLKLSDGWVRCGHCSDVFDATRYLASRATPPKPSGARPASPSSKREPSAQIPAGAVSSASAPTLTSTKTKVTASRSQSAEPRTDPVPSSGMATAFQAGVPDTNPTPEASGPPFATDQTPPKSPDDDDQPVVPAESAVPTSTPTPLPAPTAAPTAAATEAVRPIPESVAQPLKGQKGVAAPLEPGFVRQARRRAFWRSPGMRALLALVVLLLSALLAAQWALQERDRLAARYPGLQPLLASACEPLGCTIAAVRDLEAVVIDSATLTRRLGEFYSFDLVLKNTSDLALAVPALELSLTDTADAVISRRVFLPDELPGVPPLLPPLGTVSVSLRLSLAVGSELPMAGYRALVFYP